MVPATKPALFDAVPLSDIVSAAKSAIYDAVHYSNTRLKQQNRHYLMQFHFQIMCSSCKRGSS